MRSGTPTRTVEVIAHRGASDVVPEHTLAAYRHAVEVGADVVECDVRLTRDHVPVCVHDRRINRTSSGRGIVSTLELADLAELDFGSWHAQTLIGLDEGPEEPDRERTQVLTLERLLEFATSCARPVDVAIEAKHPTRYAGLVEEAVIDVLRRFGMHTPHPARANARIMSFALLSLRRSAALAPRLPTVLLMRRLPVRYRDGVLPPAVTAAGPRLDVIYRHPRYVERVHVAGGAVYAWTVDRPDDVDFVTALGVDAIITNRPGDVLAQLGR